MVNTPIFILMVIVLVAAPSVADVPLIGEKQYSYRYLINNTADYPDYYFLTTNEIMPEPLPNLIENGTFGGGYKLNGFILHALKRSDLDPEVIEILKSAEQGRKNLTDYFEKAPYKTSELSLPVGTTIDDALPIDNISVILHINEINETALNVTKEKTLYGFLNGTLSQDHNIETTDETALDVPLNFGMESLKLFS